MEICNFCQVVCLHMWGWGCPSPSSALLLKRKVMDRNFCGDSPNIIFRATVYPVSVRLKEKKFTVPVILRFFFFFYRESFNMRSHFHLHVKFDTQNHLLYRGNVPLFYTINTKSLCKILHTTIKPQN